VAENWVWLGHCLSLVLVIFGKLPKWLAECGKLEYNFRALMSVFWLNHKLGVGFVGMWLDDFSGFGFVNLVLMLAYL
jgi:hypothetical protein